MGYKVNFIVTQPKHSDPAPQIKIENLLKKFERLHWNILLSII